MPLIGNYMRRMNIINIINRVIYSSLSHNIALVKNLHSLNLQQQGPVNNFCDVMLVKNGCKFIEHFDDEMINVLFNSIACD